MVAFADTNVLVYAVDESEPAKSARARAVLRSNALRISSQVISEFLNTVTRRLPNPLPAEQALAVIAEVAPQSTVHLDRDLVLSAFALAERHRLSLWDAQIVEAARRAGCETLLTEDLTHGQVIEGVEVVNPFRDLG